MVFSVEIYVVGSCLHRILGDLSDLEIYYANFKSFRNLYEMLDFNSLSIFYFFISAFYYIIYLLNQISVVGIARYKVNTSCKEFE